MFHAPILTIEVQSKMAKNIVKILLVWLNYIKRNIFLCCDEHLHILRIILSCQDDAGKCVTIELTGGNADFKDKE